jgi:hypothetical protein
MKRFRRYLSVLLILVLTLTGHSMAIARGMPATVGYMEICNGAEIVMLATDAQGNPTGPAHICPEFSLSLLDAVAVPTLEGFLAPESRAETVLPQPETSDIELRVSAHARAPPADL